jgi:hypothetical protein
MLLSMDANILKFHIISRIDAADALRLASTCKTYHAIAFSHNWLSQVRFVVRDGSVHSMRLMHDAIYRGCTRIKYPMSPKPSADEGNFGDLFMRSGDVTVIRWLLSREEVFTNHGVAAAVENGHMDVLKMLLAAEKLPPNDPEHNHAIFAASRKGDLDALRWLIQHHHPCSPGNIPGTCSLAVALGHLCILEHLVMVHGAPIDDHLMCTARNNGGERILRWLYAQGGRCHVYDISTAALIAMRSPYNRWSDAFVKLSGGLLFLCEWHLHELLPDNNLDRFLMWLTAHGNKTATRLLLALDTNTHEHMYMRELVEEGHLSILQELYEARPQWFIGTAWTMDVMPYHALVKSRFDVLEWLFTRGLVKNAFEVMHRVVKDAGGIFDATAWHVYAQTGQSAMRCLMIEWMHRFQDNLI